MKAASFIVLFCFFFLGLGPLPESFLIQDQPVLLSQAIEFAIGPQGIEPDSEEASAIDASEKDDDLSRIKVGLSDFPFSPELPQGIRGFGPSCASAGRIERGSHFLVQDSGRPVSARAPPA